MMTAQASDRLRELALAHAAELRDAWDACRTSNRSAFKTAIVHDKAEALIGFLLRSFPGSSVSKEEVADVYKAKVNFLHADILADVPDRLVPFVVVMTSIRQNKIMLDPSQVKNWTELVERFHVLAA